MVHEWCALLRLEHPPVWLESLFLRSSSTDPKNRQVVRGPVHSGLRGVDIEMMSLLRDPSATERWAVFGIATPMPRCHATCATRRRRRVRVRVRLGFALGEAHGGAGLK